MHNVPYSPAVRLVGRTSVVCGVGLPVLAITMTLSRRTKPNGLFWCCQPSAIAFLFPNLCFFLHALFSISLWSLRVILICHIITHFSQNMPKLYVHHHTNVIHAISSCVNCLALIGLLLLLRSLLSNRWLNMTHPQGSPWPAKTRAEASPWRAPSAGIPVPGELGMWQINGTAVGQLSDSCRTQRCRYQ